MTNYVTSTDSHTPESRPGFQAWHFFVLLSMAAATAAVMVSRETHPAALLLISAAVICAGLVGVALSSAISGFFRNSAEALPLGATAREELEREKARVLRSIKELEFDRAMGKLNDEDFSAISTRLRARALTLMQDLERVEAAPARGKAVDRSGCPACGTKNDADARFCKNCGGPLRTGEARA